MKLQIISACLLVSTYSIGANKQNEKWVDNALRTATHQLLYTAKTIHTPNTMPRSSWRRYDIAFLEKQMEADSTAFARELVKQTPTEKVGTLRTCDIYDWTSGFYPGSLWYAYELTQNGKLKTQAERFTTMLNPIRHYTQTHDIGFMINCSYGNALRLTHNDTIKAVIIETADNLCKRFDPRIGCIRSWDFGTWNFPVIIDNMMNLDLLFNASKLTGNNKYRDIAIKHALTTIKHHFRPDFTSFHVVSYNADGSVEKQCTFQGKADNSAWARGQAWGVYGYTACYRETRNNVFLKQAVNIADMIMQRVKTSDNIPYWDYDAPTLPNTPRDVSAAAITASALIELSRLAPTGKKYLDYAQKILRNLSSPQYLAAKGTNNGFILMHSVGSLPNGSEIDTPINYADYYYLEALKRYIDIKK
ncbi:glycosyl hydrolase, family 88 [Prevotella sp. DNF00663]|uniref:DUF4995 domain-containing protein n=1 Tax=Prevotella sp. DNF00663 TaxID=1384078 RepID=UPI000780AFF7|nr:DUF4995 domain-containing protein [Prevotella sp. DNF00663]KXB78837.1 glycosyl hydrolase, family 88 [Prevotella sp. DNF00663]